MNEPYDDHIGEATEPGDRAGRPRRPGSRARAGLAGAALTLAAMVGAVAVLSAGVDAGAPALAPVSAGAPAAAADAGDHADAPFDDHGDDEAIDAHIACVDETFESVLGDLEGSGGEEPDLTDDEWERLEAQLDDALDGCDELLPAEWLELDEAFGEFDACLVDHGLVDEELIDDELVDDEGAFLGGELDELGGVVLVETPDGSTFVEFGEGDGEVVIAKVDGVIDVTADGDVTSETIDWDDLDHLGDLGDLDHLDDLELEELGDLEEFKGFAECEHLLPEGDPFDFGDDEVDPEE